MSMSTQTTIRRAVPQLLDLRDVLTNNPSMSSISESTLHSHLTSAWSYCKTENEKLLFFRLLLSVGDVNRAHNMFKGTKLEKQTQGGAGARDVYRSILKWVRANFKGMRSPEIMDVFFQMSDYKAGIWYQNTTDRNKAKLIKSELPIFTEKELVQYFAWKIRKCLKGESNEDSLIAKILPKWEDSAYRIRKKKVEKAGKVVTDNVLINGKPAVKGDVYKAGDILTYRSLKQVFTLVKNKWANSFIEALCKELGWTKEDYKGFRKRQNTLEQYFSSKEILKLSKDQFFKILDGARGRSRLAAKQRLFKIEKKGALPKENTKWQHLPKWYNEWVGKEAKIVEKIKNASTEEEKVMLQSKLKTKAGNMNIIDLMIAMSKGNIHGAELENMYQAIIKAMDFTVPCMVFADISGSMDSSFMYQGNRISYLDVSLTMATVFSMNNPEPSWKGLFGIFGNRAYIAGLTTTENTAPNNFVKGAKFEKTVESKRIIDSKDSFENNYTRVKSFRKGNHPVDIYSTNIGSVIEYFSKLVKNGTHHVEQLPRCIMWITDTEGNTGMMTAEQMRTHTTEIGWNPLFIFWNVAPNQNVNHLKGINNFIGMAGFNPGIVSGILENVAKGFIESEDAVWGIYDNERYSVLDEKLLNKVING